jgi:hypothetical protein
MAHIWKINEANMEDSRKYLQQIWKRIGNKLETRKYLDGGMEMMEVTAS